MSPDKARMDLSPLKTYALKICNMRQGQKPFDVSGVGSCMTVQSEVLDGPAVKGETHLTPRPPLFFRLSAG